MSTANLENKIHNLRTRLLQIGRDVLVCRDVSMLAMPGTQSLFALEMDQERDRLQREGCQLAQQLNETFLQLADAETAAKAA